MCDNFHMIIHVIYQDFRFKFIIKPDTCSGSWCPITSIIYLKSLKYEFYEWRLTYLDDVGFMQIRKRSRGRKILTPPFWVCQDPTEHKSAKNYGKQKRVGNHKGLHYEIQ